MIRLARVLESVMNGLQLALAAPPLAAALLGLMMLLQSGAALSSMDLSLGNSAGLALGFLTGAYFLGVVPAFVAGLLLPTLRQWLSPLPAALASGSTACSVYLLMFWPPGLASAGVRRAWVLLPMPVLGAGFLAVTGLAWLLARRGAALAR